MKNFIVNLFKKMFGKQKEQFPIVKKTVIEPEVIKHQSTQILGRHYSGHNNRKHTNGRRVQKIALPGLTEMVNVRYKFIVHSY